MKWKNKTVEEILETFILTQADVDRMVEEDFTVDQQQNLINELKLKIKPAIESCGVSITNSMTVYALLELAIEGSAHSKNAYSTSLFQEASAEVLDVFLNDKTRILNY